MRHARDDRSGATIEACLIGGAIIVTGGVIVYTHEHSDDIADAIDNALENDGDVSKEPGSSDEGGGSKGSKGGGGSKIPGKPFTGKNAPDAWWRDQGRPRGITRGQVRERLHRIKSGHGLNANDDVVIGRTGDVYDPQTGENIGSLTQNLN